MYQNKINLISVFVPVYNEEEILENNIKKIVEELKKIGEDFEIFIIDDNSTDKSSQIGQKLSQNNPYIKYIRFNNGPSRRENLAASFKKAGGDIIIFMDTDLATSPEYLNQLINEIKQGADIAIGSRRMGIAAKRELFRKIISQFYNSFLKLLFKSKIKDHQCGFKAFKKEFVLGLVSDMGYDKSFKRGWLWDAEILIRAQVKKINIKEFPVKWKRGEKSSFNIFRELKVIPFALNLKKKLSKS
jgi:hypothetical protein